MNFGASLVAQLVKNPPAMGESGPWSLGWEDPLEKGKSTHSSILAWRIPWTVYSPWSCKESDTPERLSLSLWWCFTGGANGKEPACQFRRHERCGFDPWVGKIPWRKKWQRTPVFLLGESYGQRSLAGYSPWDRKESDVTEVTEHAHMHAYEFWRDTNI